jgi:hypothetical protein
MTEPRTRTGKRLYGLFRRRKNLDAILAIEREAREMAAVDAAPEIARLATEKQAAEADAAALAEALGSDDDGYCRECKRMVYQFDERPGYPTEGRDRLEFHDSTCRTGIALRAHGKRLAAKTFSSQW